MKKLILAVILLIVQNSYASDSISFSEIKIPSKYWSDNGEIKVDVVVDDFINDKFDISTSKSLLEIMSAKNIRILRNSIFAKKGYIFKDEELTKFFQKKKWYKPKFQSIKLADNDKQILNLILQIENASNYSFKNFLSHFKHINLPIEVEVGKNGSIFRPFDKPTIKRNVMRKFLKTDFNVLWNHPTAIANIYSDEIFTLLLLGGWDDAGGGSVTYDILAFNKNGKLMYRHNLAYSGGDLGENIETRFVIDKKLNIIIYISDSVIDDEGSEKTTKKIKKYFIDFKGTLIKRD
jgi:hypothetical protein